MMCYRDRTYCAGPCTSLECSRLITPEVEAAAERAGLPLAISDFRATCRDYAAPPPLPGDPENKAKEE